MNKVLTHLNLKNRDMSKLKNLYKPLSMYLVHLSIVGYSSFIKSLNFINRVDSVISPSAIISTSHYEPK